MGTETATILVTDLVGSTGRRASLGEDAAEELRRTFDRLVAGDPTRFAALVASARATCAHPAMAPWLDRLDALEARAAETW